MCQLARLAAIDITHLKVVDTLVLSYLYNPKLEGGHSLEEYGLRFKFPKIVHEDWSKFSPEMLRRCEVDVELTEKVHDALLTRLNKIGFSELSAQIEHEIRRILDQQERNGFWFDTTGAGDLCRQLRQRESDLAEPIQKLFPPKLEEVATYTRRFRKDGNDFASYERHVKEHYALRDNGDGTYTTFDYRPFNIGSPTQRTERLQELGYEPTALTKKGKPKIDEDALMEYALLSGRPEMTAMAEWLVCNGRANMIETWLGYVRPDHRIHGRVMTCAASTRRMIHSRPNTANVPSAQNGAAYGNEVRALWGVEPGLGRVLMGYDATGLETVGFCNYLNNPVATKFLTEEDIHTKNMEAIIKAIGRNVVRGGGGAKTCFYAFLYGSYDKKLGSIIKGTELEGAKIRAALLGNVPGLSKLIRQFEEEFSYNNGLLRTIDGGFVRCPSLHACLNYKVQSLGGIVMKQASIFIDRKAREAGVRHLKVGDIHDEGQHDCPSAGSAEALGGIAVKSIEEAAESLNFKVRLTGNFKTGQNWSQTH